MGWLKIAGFRVRGHEEGVVFGGEEGVSPFPIGIKFWGGGCAYFEFSCKQCRVLCMFLPVRPYCMNARWIRCQADLNSFPLGEVEETTGTPPYYVDEDYPAGPEISERLPEWSNWRGYALYKFTFYLLTYLLTQNRPLCRLMSTFGTTHW